jgi:hypothetical protein
MSADWLYAGFITRQWFLSPIMETTPRAKSFGSQSMLIITSAISPAALLT